MEVGKMAFFINFVTLTAFVQIVIASSETKGPLFKSQIRDAQSSAAFRALLKNILDVNKHRYDSIKRQTNVQIHGLSPYPSRTLQLADRTLRTETDWSSDETDSDSGPDIEAFLVFPQNPSILRSSLSIPNLGEVHDEIEPYKFNMTSSPDVKLSGKIDLIKENLNEDTVKNLRQSLRSCGSELTKRCKRACKEAVRTACESYYCKSRLKRSLKKECKRSCKAEFKHGGYDNDDDDDFE